jgi:hypothetical protein
MVVENEMGANASFLPDPSLAYRSGFTAKDGELKKLKKKPPLSSHKGGCEALAEAPGGK